MAPLALKINTEKAAPEVVSASQEGKVKEYLDFSFRDYVWPLAYMISAMMIGLNFPLGYILVLIVFLNRWRFDRYDLIIQLTLFSGGYCLLLPSMDLFIPYDKILFAAAVVMMIVCKKNSLERRIIYWMAAYAAYMLAFAIMSELGVMAQFSTMVSWLGIFFFIIPIMLYGIKEFDMLIFMKKLFPYLFIFSWFFIIDGMILSGHMFLPRDLSALYYGVKPTFYNLNLHPFSFRIIRIWPQGMYITLLCVYPLLRHYKMHWWQWALVVMALLVTKTFTLYVSLLVLWAMFSPGKLKKVFMFVFGALIITGLYFIDSEPKEMYDGSVQSTLRIRSSIDQFGILANPTDEEELAKFGSSRMIVIIPAYEAIADMNKIMTGVGFLPSDPKDVKSKYVVVNPSLEDEDMRDLVMTRVEVVPLAVFFSVGIVGFVLHCAYFVVLWLIIRRQRFAMYFASVAVGFVLIGLSGFSGLTGWQGLYMCGLILAAIVMANRDESEFKEASEAKK